MINLLSKYNPFRHSAHAKRQEAIDLRLQKFEKVNDSIETRIVEKRNGLIEAARELELTVKEALDNYDGFRNN